MAIHGLSEESFEYVKKMVGKDAETPFKDEFHVYRFAAMLGLILGKKTSNSKNFTGKWNSSTITGQGEYDFSQIMEILGQELDYLNWTKSMDEYADWGIKYIEGWYGSDGKYNITGLVNGLSNGDMLECIECGFFNDSTVHLDHSMPEGKVDIKNMNFLCERCNCKVNG